MLHLCTGLRETNRDVTDGGRTVFHMSENSFPYVPRAALKRLFSASVQKSLPREVVGKESRGREKKQRCIPAQVILQHIGCFSAKKHTTSVDCDAPHPEE